MSEFDEERFAADINLPGDEQVERAARLIAYAQYGDSGMWRQFAVEARRILAVEMNRAKWQLGL